MSNELKRISLTAHNLMKYLVPTEGDVIIPSYVFDPDTGEKCVIASLNMSCFRDAINMTSITVAPTVEYIDDMCFENCVNLQAVNLFNGLKQLGANAFRHCVSLKSVYIPNSVSVIGNSSFDGCVSLKEV